MFKLLAALLTIYIVHALATRAVHAKAGIRMRLYRREEAPFQYWSAIGAYAVLVIALVFLF